MKTFTKTLFASSMLLAASTQAGTFSISVYDDAIAGAASFQDSLFSTVATEDFNDLSALGGLNGGPVVDDTTDQGSWEDRSDNGYIDTRVGRFTLVDAGQGGSNLFNTELMIESEETGEFGRQELIPKNVGDFWLDSNDARTVTWDFADTAGGGYFNAIGFELADASDVSANLRLVLSDGTFEEIKFPQANGNLKFVSITSDMAITGGSLTFDNSTANDGWGVDNVTLGRLPEPGTLLLMGLGLLGLGAARRRVAK